MQDGKRLSKVDAAAPRAGGVATLGTRDWIAAARTMLIQGGVDAVKIDRLARACKVTRGGFYWRFRDRADLLDALLHDWATSNTTPLLDALAGDDDPAVRFRRLARVWMEERDFNPDYDTAVRHWALVDPKVATVVQGIDEQRIDAFTRLFRDYGYQEDEALVRARVTYFHQVGYYAMGIRATDLRRRELTPLYLRVLTGRPPLAEPPLSDTVEKL